MTQSRAPLAKQGAQTQDIEKLDYAKVSSMTGYSLEQIALIVKTVAKDCPNIELASFLHACNALHLDPLLKQAYWIRRKSNEKGADGTWRDVTRGSLQIGIDGFRALADRQGNYIGSDTPEFRDWFELTDPKSGEVYQAPGIARVIVRKVVGSHVGSFVGEARWREFYPGEGAPGFMWRKMPAHMLAKCAEAQALRKGWPALFGTAEVLADEGMAAGDLIEVPMGEPRTTVIEQPALSVEQAQREAAAYARAYVEDDFPTSYAKPAPPPRVERSQPGPQPPEPEPIPEPDGPIDDDSEPDPRDDDDKQRQDLLVKYAQYLEACKRALGDQLNVEDWSLDDDATIEEIEFSSNGLAELLAKAGEHDSKPTSSKIEYLKLNGKLLGDARNRGTRQDLRKYTASSGWTQQAIDGANAALEKIIRDADAPADRRTAAGAEHF